MPLRDRNQIRRVVEDTGEIPTLPTVIAKINEVVRNPRTSASDVGNLIGQDQVLAAKTLRLVNSAFYGFPRKISNITRAIVILGFQKVKNIALTASVFDAFRARRDGTFDYVGFWQHSIGTAVASEALAKRLKSPDAEDAFVGGLIHDIGKIILAQFLKEECQAVMAYVAKNGCLMVDAEKEVLGLHHGLSGEWLAEKWQFPAKLTAAIRHHHMPSGARDGRDLASIVHTADIIARSLDIGWPGDDRIPVISPEVWQGLKLNPVLLDKVYEETLEGYRNAGDFLELIQGG